MPDRKFKPGAVFLAGALLVLTGVVAYEFIELNRKSPWPSLPNPNGNDDFVKAQTLLVGNPADFKRGSSEALRRRLEENAAALKLVRAGLAKQCRVPVSFSTNYLALRSLGEVKKMARLLEAEGALAELEGCTNDAARIYLETIRYGEESCRGGVMMDRLVGIACRAIGVTALQKIAGALDAGICRDSCKQLQEIERRQEAVTDVLRTESEWARRTFSLWQRVPAMIPFASLSARAQKDFVRKCHQSDAQLKRLIVDLAARAYELDRGQPAKNLAALVPDYLDALPLDPVTGTAMTYPEKRN
jgi:hypothetical protein